QAEVLGCEDSEEDEGADEAQGAIQASYGHHPRRARKKDPTKVSHPGCGRRLSNRRILLGQDGDRLAEVRVQLGERPIPPLGDILEAPQTLGRSQIGSEDGRDVAPASPPFLKEHAEPCRGEMALAKGNGVLKRGGAGLVESSEEQ